jgi:hypothetical protein
MLVSGGEGVPASPSAAGASGSCDFFLVFLLLLFLGAACAGIIEDRRVTIKPPVRLALLVGAGWKVNLGPPLFLKPRLKLIG